MTQCMPMLSMSGTFLSNQILPIKGKWEALKQRKLNISDLRENDPNEGAPKAVEPEMDMVSMQGKANTSLRELLEGPEQQQQVEDVMNVNKQEICSRNVNMYVVEPSTSAPSTVVSAQDDEMLSWLHYPVDENFERSYCSEMFGDVSNSGMQQPLPLRRSQQMVTNSTSVVSLAPKPPNAEAAMAMGAERAAGLCSQVGLEAFCRVRTSSQPPVPKWLPPPPATTTDIVTVHDQQPLKSVGNFPLYSAPMATASSNMLVLKEQGSSKAADKSVSLMAESSSPKLKQRQENVEAVLRKTPVKKEQPGSLTSAGSCRTKSFENDDFHNVQRKYEPEPTITSSSGGSENTTEKSEKAERAKRKAKQIDSAECCQSEDVEAESVDTKKKTATRPKRSRAAEVHNLSERRRRDRINEKMRALQELIPNSNKTDKASMLDEAIEYLKMLQLQLQMMSMRSGMSLPPMVMPNGVQQHLQMPQMPQLAPYGMGMGMVGVNMGMGMGMGMGMNMVDLASSSSIRPMVSEPLQQQHHQQQQQQQQLLGDSYNVFVSQQQMQVPVQMMSREMYNSYMLPQLNQPNHHHQDNQQQQQQQLHQIHHHSTGFNQ